MSESVAAAAVTAVLSAGDFGGSLTPTAQVLIDKLGDAMGKCIAHMIANNTVETNVTGAVTGGTPSSTGAFAGSGSGTVGGLTRGDAALNTGLAGEIMTELETGSYGGPLTASARAQLATIADIIAQFATYTMANADVTTTDVGVATNVNENGNTTGDGDGSAS